MEEKEKSVRGLHITTKRGLLVTLIVFILLFLSQIALIVYATYSDEKIDKLNEVLEDKIVEEEKDVSLNSDVLKSLTSISEVSLTDDSYQNSRLINFEVANSDNNLLLRLAYAKTLKSDFTGLDDVMDADDPTKDSIYLDENTLRNYFIQLFGPDVEFKPADFKTTLGNGIWPRTVIYNASLKRFEDTLAHCCGTVGPVGVSTQYKEIYKAKEVGDTLTLYKYIYVITEQKKEEYIEPYCKVTTDETVITIPETLPCNSETVNDLKKEGRIRTYKETYKKQSDGNYYIIKGEWQ